MKRKTNLVLLVILFSCPLFGQEYWNEINQSKLEKLEKVTRSSIPKKHRIFSLDFEVFKNILVNLPKDTDGIQSNTIIKFPNAEGEISNFLVYEAPIMDEILASKFPSIKSYVAEGIEKKHIKLRFSVTDFGLHAMSISNNKDTYFIDTYTKDQLNYIVYYKKDINTFKSFKCGFQNQANEAVNETNKSAQSELASDGLFRQYRLALTCNADFSQKHIELAGVQNGTITQKKAAVLSGIIVTMTRINGIYERDFSVRMNLVANNDLLIFIDTDNFDLNNILDENIAITNSTIGFSNYDIGHIFTGGGGGIAAYACVCNFDKAAGTTGSDNPVGDPFDVDYVAHEMGHQFGASHTFNNSCGDNVSIDYAVEPGSGSTIMAYAGICDPNIQSNSDAYFSVASILEVNATITNPSSCANITSNSNAAPVIAPLSNYIIPHSTAFILKGSASDSNGDILTYCWEQIDTDMSIQPPSPNSLQGPNFRSLNPTASSNRYMPSFDKVLSGNLIPTWEVVPSVSRIMNFALTVRDNRIPNGGQTSTATNIIVTANVGPFKVTYPNIQNIELSPGSTQNITWDVAGTTSNGINTSLVSILFSADGGTTFTPLATNTANDGSETITLPNITSPYCRIMIEAVNNIFYAVSPNFTLGYTFSTQCNTYTDNLSIPILSDENYGYVVKTILVPNFGIVNDVNVFNDITHDYIGDVFTDISSPLNPTDFVTLFNGNCGDLNGTLNLKFNDGASSINCISSTTLQDVQPFEPLSVFNGIEGQGTWTFRVYDHIAPDEGTMNNWSIEICQEIPSLTTNNFNLNDFALFPNPTNGTFNVQFNSANYLTTDIQVFDIRGRIVYSEKFEPSNNFNCNIKLSDVQNGIYLVHVQNGNQKEIHKIVLIK